MKFELKSYKLQKSISYLKEKPLIFIFNTFSLNSKSWLKTEQIYYNNDIKYFKVYNTLSKKAFERSIFKNMIVILNGPICFVYFDKTNNISLDLKKFLKLNASMLLIGIKLNNKIYSLPQITNIYSFNYNEKIRLLNKSLKQLLKLPSCKFGKILSK